MSEIINNSEKKRELLKELILRLHRGVDPDAVKAELKKVLGSIPYDDVVRVEQELVAGGLPREEVVKLCDVHTAVLEGSIDRSGEKGVPPGHPVHTFREENRALEGEIAAIEEFLAGAVSPGAERFPELLQHLHRLMSVDTHYRRKENLVFPFLEKHGVTAPPAVMWAKHDETRALLKKALQVAQSAMANGTELRWVVPELAPAFAAVRDMIVKEDNILLPMCMDTLTEEEWIEIFRQEPEIGYCLYDPKEVWAPAATGEGKHAAGAGEGRIVLPTGSLSVAELIALLNILPIDMTFVDADDTVRYFSGGKDRIFTRSRAIIGRKVQQCHPPASVSIVQRILDDFRSGKQNRASFWINHRDRFVLIEYFALRDGGGGYLGTLEVSQDLTEKRKLEGEQRLLSYS